VRECELTFPPGGGRKCRILVGTGALDRLAGELERQRGGGPVVVISDSNVTPLHATSFADRLGASGLDVCLLTFPAGEAAKTRDTKKGLEDRLFDLGVGSDAVVVALGGGVTGDMAGYVAATWHRGIPSYQAPTTLIGMVDAAIGGKTGVDLPGAKNQVGAYHQPVAVYADTAVLSTLPDENYLEGFAEVVKTAVIGDLDFFSWLENSVEQLRGRSSSHIEEMVHRCVRIKGGIVEADEREGGRRAVLNFGHTVGHAIEVASGLSVGHGAAVSIGMVVEGMLARVDTGFPEDDNLRLKELLEMFGLPVAIPSGLDSGILTAAMQADKKNRRGAVMYAPPLRLGVMQAGDAVTLPLDPARLAAALGSSLKP